MEEIEVVQPWALRSGTRLLLEQRTDKNITAG